MSASTQDVNLIIIHEGKKTYWSGMKACGHVALDLRFGLYSDEPKPDLSWIEGTTWEEILQALEAPLEQPNYGDLVIDFDRRVITDSTGWSPFQMYPQWLAMTWDDPRDAPVAKESVIDHLVNLRVQLGTMCRQGGEDKLVQLSADYDAATQQVAEVKYSGGASIHFAIPAGWSLEQSE